MPLDNLCVININSPSSKCNAKLQLAVHERGIISHGDGFHLDIPKDGKAKSVTAIEYYCWRLMQRDGWALT